MFEFRLVNGLFLNEEVLESYVDVYIHCENNEIVQGHMIVLAQQSPYLHRHFQSRKEMKVADLFFTNIRHSVIKNAIRILYCKIVNVPEHDSKRICSFLKMIQVKFEMISDKGEIEVPVKAKTQEGLNIIMSTSEEKEDDIVEETSQVKEDELIKKIPKPTPESEVDGLDLQWTLTTTDWERIEDIHHTVERDETSKYYKCKHCPTTSREYKCAKTHYRNKHQDLEEEKNLLIKVQTERMPLLKKYQDISSSGTNKSLVKHEAETILEKLNSFVNALENVEVPLSPHLEYKKRDLLKILGADILSIRNFINKLSTI
jgi:hypothetical protein